MAIQYSISDEEEGQDVHCINSQFPVIKEREKERERENYNIGKQKTTNKKKRKKKNTKLKHFERK